MVNSVRNIMTIAEQINNVYQNIMPKQPIMLAQDEAIAYFERFILTITENHLLWYFKMKSGGQRPPPRRKPRLKLVASA